MTNSDAYSVVSTGKILDGFGPDDVRKRLISALRLTPAQAESFFEKPRVLKKDVTWAGADKLCSQLATLGIAAQIQSPAPAAESAPAAPVAAMQDEPALELVNDEPDAASGQGTVECPNCNLVQAKSEQCESCGIWFHKFESTPAPARPMSAPAASAPKINPAAAIQVGGTTDDSSNGSSEKSELSLVAIGAAFGAALIGAWLWRFIAVTFEYEFGLIAWGIGGAVGIAAASAGSKGMQAGFLCAILAFGSIVLGKYWAYDEFVDQFQEAISGAMEMDDEMRLYYEDELVASREFVRGSGSDIAVRRFMVDQGYTYATNPADVTTDELDEFREYVEPELRQMADNPPSYEEWQERGADSLGELSPWAMMREDFGFLDVLFIFLGVGTAFRLGSQLD